ncbi:diguanylate cyclase domain-containing protein [Lyngbya sp. PCC 8106]|uniref:diguanylate cyclase domain-containing protein n=1 Tax=Lyngbya sp. (strain PCC 8106) TaxID=313612 RepID=UPI0000EAA3D2|nr:diguanylate cyclase [Lyngbya sp. PCC 8106]EAW37806.1 PleD-like protein [Lyngbya sp. PCC 8106]
MSILNHILIVDDTPADLNLLIKILSSCGYHTRIAPTGKLAIESAKVSPPDLIMLDIKLPDIDGYSVCQQLKLDEKTFHIPIVFLSALDGVFNKVKAFEVGGADYVTKPYESEEVLARIKFHLAHQKLLYQLETQNRQLLQQEERWQLLLKGTGDGIFDWNIKTGEAFKSITLKAMLGYTDEEMKNDLEAWKNLLHSEDCERVLTALNDYLTRKVSSFKVEYRLRCKDGSYKWILARGQAVWAEDNTPLRMIGFHQDISERKKNELINQQMTDDLRRSEAKFRGAFDTITAGMCLVSILGKIIDVNAALCQMFEYDSAELLSLHLSDLIFVDDQTLDDQLAQQMFRGEIPGYQIEKRFLTQSNQIIWGLMNISLMYDQKNSPHYLIVHIVDISDRKKIEAALCKNITTQRAILKAIPDLMIRLDRNGICKSIGLGKSLQKFSRIPYILQQSIYQTLPPRLAEQQMYYICQALTTNERQIYEYSLEVDGELHYQEARVVKLDDHEVLMMIRDISDRKQSEIKLQQANFTLEKLAHTDGLTQIANRRYFDDYLIKEWQRLRREKQYLSLILLDIDYFKFYNDFYGHQSGDKSLISIAQAIKKTLKRPADLVARYGGEEFVVVLPNTNQKGVINIAQQIQQMIRTLAIVHQKSQVSNIITLSQGIACTIPNSKTSPAQLIAQADKVLYTAKQQGRNRYIVSS